MSSLISYKVSLSMNLFDVDNVRCLDKSTLNIEFMSDCAFRDSIYSSYQINIEIIVSKIIVSVWMSMTRMHEQHVERNKHLSRFDFMRTTSIRTSWWTLYTANYVWFERKCKFNVDFRKFENWSKQIENIRNCSWSQMYWTVNLCVNYVLMMNHKFAKKQMIYNIFKLFRIHVFEVVAKYDIVSRFCDVFETVMCLKKEISIVFHNNAFVYFTSIVCAY